MNHEEPKAVVGDELTAAQLHDILAIRTEIFVVEQECPYLEVDGFDLKPDTTHCWFEDDGGKIESYLRILTEPDQHRIGRVLTRQDRRGSGVSRKLMAAALVRLGPGITILSAQSYLTGYYESFGFDVVGPEYIEDGIPHVPMRREA